MKINTLVGKGMSFGKPILQDKNTRRYTLNAITYGEGNIPNEQGNFPCLNHLPTGYLPIGSIPLLIDESAIFLVNPLTGGSKIGIMDSTCKYTELIDTPCLGFRIDKQIVGEYKMIGCDRNIYFTDSFNDIRTINLDKLDQYKDVNGNWDCSLFNLIRDFLYPTLKFSKILDTGGSTSVGVYQFSIAYTDQDFNATNWQYVTLPVPIVTGSITGNYPDIQGGDSTYPITTKSIQLDISNLDTRFAYYRIAVIATVNSVTTGYLLDTIPISGSTDTYTFTGINPTTDTTIVLSDFNALKIGYQTAEAMGQVEKSLILANITEKQVNFADFQKQANQIQVTYRTYSTQYNAETPNISGPKGAQYYAGNKSYMRDEIYAAGIVWVFTDGYETPVFHIPGRALDTAHDGTHINDNVSPFDEAAGNSSAFGITVAPNLHNRRAANIGTTKGWDSALYPNTPENGSMFPTTTINRWELYNTAIRTFKETDPNRIVDGDSFTEGECAYWQANKRYPAELDCNNIPVYPHVITDPTTYPAVGSYTMDFIRHHKMPDTTLEPHYLAYDGSTDGSTVDNTIVPGTDKILPLGLRFRNVIPPSAYANQILGYYIVRSLRDDTNSTVIDKGVMYNNVIIQFANTNSDPLQNIAFRQASPYNKDRNEFELPASIASTLDCGQDKNFNIIGDSNTYDTLYQPKCLSLHLPREKFYKTIPQGDYIKIERELQGNVEYLGYDDVGDDYNFKSKVKYKSTKVPIHDLSTRQVIHQKSVKAQEQVGPGTFSLPFWNNNSLETFVVETEYSISVPTYTDQSLYQLYASTSPNYLSAAYYVSLKKIKVDAYADLGKLSYTNVTDTPIAVSNTDVLVYGGDCFIALMAVRKVTETALCGTDSHNAEERVFFWYWGESIVNTELRHEGDLTIDASKPANQRCIQGYYPKTYQTFQQQADWLDLNSSCYNTYLYNKDYSQENTTRIYIPLEDGFQFCKDCTNVFKHRVAASEKAQQEDRQDMYRVFKVNNYIDLPGQTGEITAISVNVDQLLIHTTQSLWFQQTKPQKLNTDAGQQVFIDSGQLFSLPPQEVVSVKTGYAGCQSRIATLTNELGTVITDQRRGKIFLYSDGKLDEISASNDNALKYWFQDNLPSSIEQQYQDKYNKDFPLNDNPSNPSGTGIQTAIDRTISRIMFFKKDYKIIDPTILGNQLILSGASWLYNGQVINPFKSPDIFEDTSWTLSFSLVDKSWTSFHSYIPNFVYYNSKTFYSYKEGLDDIWEHNKGSYQTFYNTKYPFIVEFVINNNPDVTKIFSTIEYVSSVQVFNIVTNSWIDVPNVTFDKVVAYTDYQSTGLLDLVVGPIYNSLNYSGSVINVKRRDRTWRFSQLRDMWEDKTLSPFTTAWSNLDYRSSYPIDKVVNQLAINPAMDQYKMSKLRDKYLIVRLESTASNDYIFSIELSQSQQDVSIR